MHGDLDSNGAFVLSSSVNTNTPPQDSNIVLTRNASTSADILAMMSFASLTSAFDSSTRLGSPRSRFASMQLTSCPNEL